MRTADIDKPENIKRLDEATAQLVMVYLLACCRKFCGGDSMSNKKIILPILIAAILWFLMFLFRQNTCSTFDLGLRFLSILMLTAIVLRKDILKQFQWSLKSVGIGLLSAAVLWMVFYRRLFSSLIFDLQESRSMEYTH